MLLATGTAQAGANSNTPQDRSQGHIHCNTHGQSHSPSNPISHSHGPADHAPIGVMGDHLHKKGEWMLSYRFMTMDMEDNLRGSNNLSPEEIVSSTPNRFANPPMMPPRLRVVPTQMTTEMHMLGLMYAPSDQVTLMAMLNYIDKDMQHITFQGPMGTQRLGNFTTHTSGIGDTKVAALVGLYDSPQHKLHLNIGMSLPTGSIDETGEILTPMNTRPSPRLPYPMQLGSGTYDFEPRLTYRGYQQQWGWGAQFKALLRLGENDEGYSLGNQTRLTAWGSYRFTDTISASLRLSYQDSDRIDGIDPNIVAPVQTADPDNQGGERVDLGVGVNYLHPNGHRLALEYETVLDQDLNGVQLEMQSMLNLGYQYAF